MFKPFLALLLIASPALAAPPESVNLRRTVTVDVVEKTKNAVVNIAATKRVRQRVSMFPGDPFFENFGPGQIVEREAGSLGSGFIVHPDGYVITNNHVIDRARTVTVELADGRKLPTEVISADADVDLAVLKIREGAPFPTVPLGDSSDLMIGEPVIAVGNPFGFAHSVSTGIVSALHRDIAGAVSKSMGDLVQTDAAINPGNSGGPLLNAYGQVIGINTAIRGDAQNIGFAIPVNTLRQMIPELLSPEHASKIDLAVKLEERRELLPPAIVKPTVTLDGRAVRKINGKPVSDIIDAYVQMLKVRAGDKVQIDVEGADPISFTAKELVAKDLTTAWDRLGLRVQELSPALAEKYGMAQDSGMLVTEVSSRGPAAAAGFQPGDVLVQMGRFFIRDQKDFAQLMTMLPESGRVRVGVVRGNQSGYLTLNL